MGEHEKPEAGWVTGAKALAAKTWGAVRWFAANRGKILGVAVVALPLVARYVPSFPADAVLSVVRAFLGA